MMKKLLLLLFILAGVSHFSFAQTQPIGLFTLPYVCQADSFPVTLSGYHPNGGQRLDSVVNSYRNDSLLLKYYFSWFAGPTIPVPFQITRKFPTPQPGNYTIYAKQFLNNGPNYAAYTTHISVCAGISGLPHNGRQNLEVYPNPTTSRVILKNLPQNGIITLSDITGRTLRLQNITTEALMIDLNHYPTGLYFLAIETANGKTVQKIIKN